MNILSSEQIIDAAGGFADTARTTVGLKAAEFDPSEVPSPSYSEVAATYQVNDRQAAFEVPSSTEDRAKLANYPGLRVTISKRVLTRAGDSRVVYFPGIVLETAPGQPPGIGILAAGPDMIRDDAALTAHHDRPFSSLQQTMLNRLYGLQTPNAGQHDLNGSANVGETAHGALISVTDPRQITSLHGRVHQYIPNGLAKSLSQAPRGQQGAVDLPTSEGIRPVRDDVVSALEAGKITVAEKHQLPPSKGSLNLGLGQLVVGTTLAAVRSKATIGFPQPDLRAGMIAVARG